LDPGRQLIVDRGKYAAVSGLYVIADTSLIPGDRLAEVVEQAIRGGARLVQYRDKGTDADRRRQQAQKLATLCRRYRVPFLVNDDIELAAAVGADGVHLGREDESVAEARRSLGSEALVGVSCYNDIARARDAQAAGADYIAFGSFFPSSTKPEAVRADTALLQEAHGLLSLPVVAIGGITPENGAELIAAGADALAVITGVFASDNITAAAARYARLFERRSSDEAGPHENPISGNTHEQ
jgi:thiamine-phosphate pyrophosphorylase